MNRGFSRIEGDSLTCGWGFEASIGRTINVAIPARSVDAHALPRNGYAALPGTQNRISGPPGGMAMEIRAFSVETFAGVRGRIGSFGYQPAGRAQEHENETGRRLKLLESTPC